MTTDAIPPLHRLEYVARRLAISGLTELFKVTSHYFKLACNLRFSQFGLAYNLQLFTISEFFKVYSFILFI